MKTKKQTKQNKTKQKKQKTNKQKTNKQKKKKKKTTKNYQVQLFSGNWSCNSDRYYGELRNRYDIDYLITDLSGRLVLRVTCQLYIYLIPGTFPHTIRIPETNVPAKETTYICMLFEFPSHDDFHLVATEPHIDTVDIMHHIIIYGCDPSS